MESERSLRDPSELTEAERVVLYAWIQAHREDSYHQEFCLLGAATDAGTTYIVRCDNCDTEQDVALHEKTNES